MIWEISLAVIAAAFVILVIYLIIAIFEATKLLRTLNLSLHKAHLGEIAEESLLAMKNANSIASNLQGKMQNLDPLFQATQNLGTGLNNLTENLVQRSPPPQQKLEVNEVVNWIALGINIWQKIKK